MYFIHFHMFSMKDNIMNDNHLMLCHSNVMQNAFEYLIVDVSPYKLFVLFFFSIYSTFGY